MTFKDKTFCASKGCTNKCGNKMTEQETEELKSLPRELQLVRMSHYCKGDSRDSLASEAGNNNIAAAETLENIVYH